MLADRGAFTIRMFYKSYIIPGIYKWKSFQINLPFYRFKTDTENLSDYPSLHGWLEILVLCPQSFEAPKKEADLPV